MRVRYCLAACLALILAGCGTESVTGPTLQPAERPAGTGGWTGGGGRVEPPAP